MVYRGSDFLIRKRSSVEKILDDQVLVSLSREKEAAIPAAQ
jgi:hypothetical protein